HASSILYSGASPDACSGSSCSASATFTIIDSNDFQITLNNTIPVISNASQLLTDLSFSLTAFNVTMTNSSGTFIDISSHGNVSVLGTYSTGWGFGNSGAANQWLLCIICGDGVWADGAQPSEGIIDNQSSYASANGSIDGNSAHNPF